MGWHEAVVEGIVELKRQLVEETPRFTQSLLLGIINIMLSTPDQSSSALYKDFKAELTENPEADQYYYVLYKGYNPLLGRHNTYLYRYPIFNAEEYSEGERDLESVHVDFLFRGAWYPMSLTAKQASADKPECTDPVDEDEYMRIIG